MALFAGIRKQITEYGSVASTNSHLAGSSDVESSEVVQQFCIKHTDEDEDSESSENSEDEDKETYFMKGKTASTFDRSIYTHPHASVIKL